MKQRLLSLDLLRGITVFGMIVVNNAGGEYSYDSLRHSVWNGLTPCDLVFPFFLFIRCFYIDKIFFSNNQSLHIRLLEVKFI